MGRRPRIVGLTAAVGSIAVVIAIVGATNGNSQTVGPPDSTFAPGLVDPGDDASAGVELGSSLGVLSEGSRVYVLDEDVPGVPEDITYDEVIATTDVAAVFLAGGAPECRALIVTKDFVESAEAPAGGQSGSGGNDEYFALLHVLWHQHVLFALDSSSELVGTKLELDGNATPFDPFGRLMPIRPPKAGYMLTGTGLKFTVDGGWEQHAIESRVADEPTPEGSWIGSSLSNKPAYDLINGLIDQMLVQ